MKETKWKEDARIKPCYICHGPAAIRLTTPQSGYVRCKNPECPNNKDLAVSFYWSVKWGASLTKAIQCWNDYND